MLDPHRDTPIDPPGKTSPTGKAYVADGITVYYDVKRCRHFTQCLRALPAVFDEHARPWIQPANADLSAVTDAVRRCPSGALHYVLDDGPSEQPQSPTTVRVLEGGPVVMRGDLKLDGPDGPINETRAAVCGCGKSENAPFCDGACGCKPWRMDV